MITYIVSFSYQIIGGPWEQGHMQQKVKANSAQEAVDSVAEKCFEYSKKTKLWIDEVFQEVKPQGERWEPSQEVMNGRGYKKHEKASGGLVHPCV